MRPFFGVTVAMLAASVLKDLTIDGHLPAPENLVFHGAFGAFGVAAMVITNARFHFALALITAALLASYIALLFSVLA